MAFEKKYDLVVATGEYKDRGGNTKKKWLTVGAMFEGDNGPFIVIEPYINFGALPRGAKGSVVVSCFEPKDGNQQERSKPAPQGRFNASADNSDFDDDIPF